ncbi:DUF3160 domain-containing protein [candidate division KSB1 bacterium]|nr:DUF3160 domain-containing protein [candidate division KSB1 bacterium]
MKFIRIAILLVLLGIINWNIQAQSSFSTDAYAEFLKANQDLNARDLLTRHAVDNSYFSDLKNAGPINDFAYLDSIQMKLELTPDELALLLRNHFMVSERLSFNCPGHALHAVYRNDLPVFISTDLILNALHVSYDEILMSLECVLMEQNLKSALEKLVIFYPQLLNKYGANPDLQVPLADVDLYITLALSLLKETLLTPVYANPKEVGAVWQAVQSEKMVKMPLFSNRSRELDFSQFTVRGHYSYEFYDHQLGKYRNLGAYFKTMMWLGRMNFMLTPPPVNPFELPWSRKEIQWMVLGAFMLNELMDLANSRALLAQNDQIIDYLVGESDNLTPAEFSQILSQLGISNATDLLDDATYDRLQFALLTSQNAGQKILSHILIMDPFSAEPDTLPVTFLLMGQRFIVDSYIFYNVVFPQIIYQNKKIWRPLPDPLDAMFVLGNNNALPLLQDELDRYQYSSQLASLRYLVESYDEQFWDASLYNVWLQSIRKLDPEEDFTKYPLFMRTVAWQQEKLNTQLASWAQLRHDNLLYAKQSYTGGTACSFPHSFVEPYPAFYQQIASYAQDAAKFFGQLPVASSKNLKEYFTNFGKVVSKLEAIATKELTKFPLTAEEISFLKQMLFLNQQSGAPPYTGWYADLFYSIEKAAMQEPVIVDVHTQPYDEFGNPVGRVLHAGVGNFNLGVFLASTPGDNYCPMAFVGPVMSYYELITENFNRLTDEEWASMVQTEKVPARPDWTHIYLADKKGNSLASGRELPGINYTTGINRNSIVSTEFQISQNYPNPFNPNTTISYYLPTPERVVVKIFDIAGREVAVLLNSQQPAGPHKLVWYTTALPSGIYFCQIQAGSIQKRIKMILMK